jgi:hypothetical protein
VENRFFVTTIVDGGPHFRPLPQQRYCTGDTIHPLVELLEPNGARVPAAVFVDVERPRGGTGNILTQSRLQASTAIDGDRLDARTSTLLALEAEQGGPLIPRVTERFTLFDDGEHGDRGIEEDGIFGSPLDGMARYEGNYTFRAVASFGTDTCNSTRETTWSAYVAVGIDPDETTVTAVPVGSLQDGRTQVRVTITPRDRFGGFLEPGRRDAFHVEEEPGSELIGEVVDPGDGSYVQEIGWDPASGPPALVVTQSGRPSVIVASPISPPFVFIRSDFNGDYRVDIADPIYLVQWLFWNGAVPPCLDAADSNDDGNLDLADPVYSLNNQFIGTDSPPEPFPAPGLDPTPVRVKRGARVVDPTPRVPYRGGG